MYQLCGIVVILYIEFTVSSLPLHCDTVCESQYSDTIEPMLYSSLVAEIARVQAGQDKDKYVELHNDKPLKLAVKVRVPVKEFPKVCIASFRCIFSVINVCNMKGNFLLFSVLL